MMAGLRGDAAAEATGQPPAAGAEPTLSEGGTEAAAALPAIGTFLRPTTPLKDRFNYLSSTVGAKVLAASPEMQNERNILNEDKDKYMMTEREVKKKWVTVSLGSEDILLDTVVLANFEYYSSS